MGKELVHQLLAPRNVRLAGLQHPDAPPGQQPHLDVPQALEGEGPPRLAYGGWKQEEAGGSWSAWLHYEVPLPPPTHRTRGCESSVYYLELHDHLHSAVIHDTADISVALVVGPKFFRFYSFFATFISGVFSVLSVCFSLRKFDQDLESVSSGLKRLKHLSKAFDDIIGRDNG